MSEQEQATTTTEEARPLEDADLEKVGGGTSPIRESEKPDHWHKLPDGSGSGAGE